MSDDLSKKEAGVISIMRLNEALPRREIRKQVAFMGRKFAFSWRSKKNLWGRFGGGWNWKVGVMVGGSTIIVDCLVFSLSMRKSKS